MYNKEETVLILGFTNFANILIKLQHDGKYIMFL